MQAVFYLDTDADGIIDTTLDSIAALTAKNIRDQIKEIRVYILAHEGSGILHILIRLQQYR